ncbi:hypothetical protein H5410_029306 [Solanum commersonii]|uniref:Uncharacterized protein n=1 Tax=Solanum commersonii TaxID=4109 RepID=A0A9J5ZA55_SOLCO|nr:hypothetical protein H5410_029306 [Solanum commersonii]
MAHLHGHTIPIIGKPLILTIFECYSHRDFMVTRNSHVIFAKKFTWTSVKTLVMETVGHHSQINAFTSPRDFMVTQNFYVIFAKNLHGSPLRP